MPNPVTNLSGTLDAPNARVNLSWTNPSGSLTQILVEGLRQSATTWNTLYLGPVVSTLPVYPGTLVPWQLRVTTVDATGRGTPTVCPGTFTIAGKTPRQYPVCISPVNNPGLQVWLGASDNLDSLSWKNQTMRFLIEPMGQQNARPFFYKKRTKAAEEMNFGIIDSDPDGQGGFIFAQDVMNNLEMFENQHLQLVYRDNRIGGRYCYMWDVHPRPWQGPHIKVSFYLLQADPAGVVV